MNKRQVSHLRMAFGVNIYDLQFLSWLLGGTLMQQHIIFDGHQSVLRTDA